MEEHAQPPQEITCSDGLTYRFCEVLGRGGFATCYLVRTEQGDAFACKVIPKRRLDKPRLRDKLESEIAIHRELRHPHIVRFVSTAEDAERVYIVLERCSQRTLHELMRMRKRLSEREAARILLQLVSAVLYLHGRRVIHRDIKLHNLFVHDGACKLGDFGLAAQLEAEGERRTTLCGTPNFIAPEVLRKGVDGHSYPADAWSVGVVLYCLVVGRPPFDAGGDVKKAYARIREVLSEGLVFPPAAELSDPARQLICALLHPDSEKRMRLADVRAHPFAALLDAPPTPGPTFQLIDSVAGSPDGSGDVGARRLPLGADAASERVARTDAPAAASPLAGRALGASGAQTAAAFAARAPALVAKAALPRARALATDGPLATDEPLCGAPALVAGGGHAGGVTRATGRAARAVSAPRGGSARASVAPNRGAAPDAPLPSAERARRERLAPAPRAQLCLAPALCTRSAAAACVSRWCDFSALYGIGWELLDGTVGGCYNDGSRLVLAADKLLMEYHAASSRGACGERDAGGVCGKRGKPMAPPLPVVRFCARASAPAPLLKKVKLLRHFEKLLQPHGADTPRPFDGAPPRACAELVEVRAADALPHVRRSVRLASSAGAGARAFRLSNRWLQLLFDDGAELLAPLEGDGPVVHAGGRDLRGGEYDCAAAVSSGAALRPPLARAAALCAHAARLLGEHGLATPAALARAAAACG